MIYKFAAADMDGTLLNDKNEITPYTIEIIRQAAAQGLIFLHLHRGAPFREWSAIRNSWAFRDL